MSPVVETSLDVEELIKTLNPAELAEAARRCKAKAQAYLRSAQLIDAWRQANAEGTRN
jgi:hypothetical protein